MSSDSSATQRSTLTVVLWIVVAALAITSITLAALYYQATRDLEAQNAKVAALRLEIAKEVARAAELKSDLNASRTDAQTLVAKSAQLSSEIDSKEHALAAERNNVEAEKSKAESVQAALNQEKSRLPAVPVRIEMRRSVAGRGLVAMFTNTSAMQLSVVMGTLNPTTKAFTKQALQIAPGKKVEIGYLEGVQFASGDEIRMRSAGFEEIRYNVP
jgi:cell division protein FtsB